MAYLLHSDFFCSTPWGLYMSFILSIDFCTFLPKNNTANHRSFQLFSVIYVLYIINTVIGEIPIKRIPQFAMPVSPFFENLCPYIINRFLGKLFDIATFLMLMHTYSLIPLSMQIRASLSDENSV